MTEDGSPDALSFAFVTIVAGEAEAYTMGMHVLGLREVVMKSSDAEQDEFGIIDVIRYLARGEKPVGDGHLLADLSGPQVPGVHAGKFRRVAWQRDAQPLRPIEAGKHEGHRGGELMDLAKPFCDEFGERRGLSPPCCPTAGINPAAHQIQRWAETSRSGRRGVAASGRQAVVGDGQAKSCR